MKMSVKYIQKILHIIFNTKLGTKLILLAKFEFDFFPQEEFCELCRTDVVDLQLGDFPYS